MPLTCPPSLVRYAIPPEHGKRLERLAIGRCLRLWAATWDLGSVVGEVVRGQGGETAVIPPRFAICLGFNFWEQ